ncbi:MAG: hypothetical protein HFJ60_08610 [Clostridia bacterium]|nr:hypothetical protein [Clostridia bacterium]
MDDVGISLRGEPEAGDYYKTSGKWTKKLDDFGLTGVCKPKASYYNSTFWYATWNAEEFQNNFGDWRFS